MSDARCCVAACCSALQCVASTLRVCCSACVGRVHRTRGVVLQRVAVCCSVLQCVAVCCSVLQCEENVSVRCVLCGVSVLILATSDARCCVSVCCSVLQCCAVCCSAMQSVAVYAGRESVVLCVCCVWVVGRLCVCCVCVVCVLCVLCVCVVCVLCMFCMCVVYVVVCVCCCACVVCAPLLYDEDANH